MLLGTASDEAIDVSVVGNAIDEARRALPELARLEAKAKSIAHGADEIRSLLRSQVRRLNAALDDAAAGLSNQRPGPHPDPDRTSRNRPEPWGSSADSIRRDVTTHGSD